MNIFTQAIVSNSSMIKSYRTCREKAGVFGKIFIMKNNQPDAVLFSHDEYDKISEIVEYLEEFDQEAVKSIMELLPKVGSRKKHSIKELREKMQAIKDSHFKDGLDRSAEDRENIDVLSATPIKFNRMELKKNGNENL